MDWQIDEERAFWRAECQRNFYSFLTHCYGVPDRYRDIPWFDPRIHKQLADWFQFHIQEWRSWRLAGISRQKHLAIIVPREVGKTTIITQAGLLWLHLQDPELATYIGSEKTEFAVQFLTPIKATLEGSDSKSKFTWLYGSWYDPKRTWKTEQIVHAARKDLARKEFSFGTWGVESGLTSMHPDVLCLDDPISYEKLASHNNWLTTVNNHLVSLIPVLTGAGLFIMPGTRYHDGDHFGRAFKIDGIKSITGMTLPDNTPRPDGIWDVFFIAGKDHLGKATCPRTWTLERMARLEKNDPLRFAAQVMNDPANSLFNPLTLTQVRSRIRDPKEMPRNLRYTLHMDTAFKSMEKQAKGDDSVIQVWGHERDGSGNVWFVEGYGSNFWRAEDFAEKVAILIQKYKKAGHRIVMITDEMQVGGKDGSWELALTSYCHNAGVGMPPFITLMRGGKKKLMRLVEAASFWIDGHVFLPNNAPGLEQLVTQMSRIGSSEHDDWADCAADVFHKDVYDVMHRLHGKVPDSEESAARPWDAVLKDGRMPDPQSLLMHYAEWESDYNYGRETV